MIQQNPKQKGLKKTKVGRKLFGKVAFTKSKSKRSTKGEPMANPLSYPRKFEGFNL